MTAAPEDGIVPTELDILCGKTKQIISHPGTIRYQRIVESYTQRYINAESKFDKMSVTKSLYDYLKTTSRFLKFNDKTQTWEEITALAARDKVGHALRFAVNNVNNEKKRMKSKRGHRRAGSDWSAASVTSISSAISTNTNQSANTATSDGGPMVQNLMQALSSNFNLSELQGEAPSLNGEHPLRAGSNDHPLLRNNNAGEHPLRRNNNNRRHHRTNSVPIMGSSNMMISTIDEHPGRPSGRGHARGHGRHHRASSNTINDHPLLGNSFGAIHEFAPSPSPISDPMVTSAPPPANNFPINNISAPTNDVPMNAPSNDRPPLWAPSAAAADNNNSPRSSIHSSNASGQPVLQRKISDDDLDFLKQINDTTTDADFVTSSVPMTQAPPPPITEVSVTAPQQTQQRTDAEFNSNFLSMLHEPIYEFDVEELDEANEDLY